MHSTWRWSDYVRFQMLLFIDKRYSYRYMANYLCFWFLATGISISFYLNLYTRKYIPTIASIIGAWWQIKCVDVPTIQFYWIWIFFLSRVPTIVSTCSCYILFPPCNYGSIVTLFHCRPCAQTLTVYLYLFVVVLWLLRVGEWMIWSNGHYIYRFITIQPSLKVWYNAFIVDLIMFYLEMYKTNKYSVD